MALTQLTAVSIGTFNQWALGSGANKVAAVNSDDGPAIGSHITSNTPGDRQTFNWTDLPVEAASAGIVQYEIESDARRAGGAIQGEYRSMIYDGVNQIVSATHVPGLATPPATFLDVFPTRPDGAGWTQPDVDSVQAGVIDGPVGSSGVNVFYMILNITWLGQTPGQEVDAISWLGPLALLGLRGLNLFNESVEGLLLFERGVLRPAFRKAGVRTFPTLALPEDKERLLWDLFKQPVYSM